MDQMGLTIFLFEIIAEDKIFAVQSQGLEMLDNYSRITHGCWGPMLCLLQVDINKLIQWTLVFFFTWESTNAVKLVPDFSSS